MSKGRTTVPVGEEEEGLKDDRAIIRRNRFAFSLSKYQIKFLIKILRYELI